MKIQTTVYINDLKEMAFKTETIPDIDKVKIGLSVKDLTYLEKNLEMELGSLENCEKVFKLLNMFKIEIRTSETINSLFPKP